MRPVSVRRTFVVEAVRQGRSLWREEVFNLVPNAALGTMLGIVFGSTAKPSGLYLGLKGTGEALAGDTLSSHSLWSEITPYSGNRATYTNGNALNGVYTAWAASTGYTVGTIVIPTTANGHQYKCTTAGTSSSAAPTWPTTEGGTVTDGTVTWTEDATANASVDNSAAKAVFNVSSSATVYGIFLTDQASGTTGILYGVADFSTSRSVISGDALYCTATTTMTSQT